MGHIPQRQCMLCREKFPKPDLLRFVKNKDEITIDKNNKKDGRGAYICKECQKSDMLVKKRVLDRAFKMRVPDEIYDLLKGENDG